MADPEIPEAAVQAAAEKLREHYDSEFDATHMAWQDFAPQAREVLAAALPHLPLVQGHNPLASATCPACRRRVDLLPDGIIATHVAPAPICPGSHQWMGGESHA